MVGWKIGVSGAIAQRCAMVGSRSVAASVPTQSHSLAVIRALKTLARSGIAMRIPVQVSKHGSTSSQSHFFTICCFQLMELGALGEPGMGAHHRVTRERKKGPGHVISPVQPMVAFSARVNQLTQMCAIHTLAQVQ